MVSPQITHQLMVDDGRMLDVSSLSPRTYVISISDIQGIIGTFKYWLGNYRLAYQKQGSDFKIRPLFLIGMNAVELKANALRRHCEMYCLLDDALAHHCIGYFHEACDVCSLHVVDVAVGFSAVFNALGVDILHDRVETRVYFLFTPLEVFCVLAHFET